MTITLKIIKGNVMASRAVDLLIAYRVIKLLVTPFEKHLHLSMV